MLSHPKAGSRRADRLRLSGDWSQATCRASSSALTASLLRHARMSRSWKRAWWLIAAFSSALSWKPHAWQQNVCCSGRLARDTKWQREHSWDEYAAQPAWAVCPRFLAPQVICLGRWARLLAYK